MFFQAVDAAAVVVDAVGEGVDVVVETQASPRPSWSLRNDGGF